MITTYILVFIALIVTIGVLFSIAFQIRKREKLIMSGYYDDPLDSENEQNSLGTQLWKEGIEFFGSEDSFLVWMNKTNLFLKDSKPIDLIKTQEGREIVLEELDKLKHGIV